MSDMRVAGSAAEGVYRFAEGGIRVASLNHAIWFHRPACADDWMLIENRAVSNAADPGPVWWPAPSTRSTAAMSRRTAKRCWYETLAERVC